MGWTGHRSEKPLFEGCLDKVSSRDKLKTCTRCKKKVCSKCAPKRVCKQCQALEKSKLYWDGEEQKHAALQKTRLANNPRKWERYTRCECETRNAKLASSDDRIFVHTCQYCKERLTNYFNKY